jgi:hypothetical protein
VAKQNNAQSTSVTPVEAAEAVTRLGKKRGMETWQIFHQAPKLIATTRSRAVDELLGWGKDADGKNLDRVLAVLAARAIVESNPADRSKLDLEGWPYQRWGRVIAGK